MAVDPITTSVGPGKASTQASGKQVNSAKRGGINAAGFDTFLKLLTTQMKSQDPLNPLKSTDFIAQLANFSSVEQEVRMNESLSKIEAALGGDTANALAGWVGQSVRAEGKVRFQGRPLEIEIDPTAGAEKAQLVVRDNTGNEVQRLSVPLDQPTFSWNGAAQNGVSLPPGDYELSIESFFQGKMIDSHPVGTFANVVEAQLDRGKVSLILDNGLKVAADAVSAVRRGQATQ